MKAYLVGGYVRDHQMNRLLGTAITAKDRDWVVVGSTESEMLKRGFTRVGKFPVFLHPENREEWALARTEKKTGNGYTGFEVDFNPNVTLEEDLSRRDLTINAMAQDPESGVIIDPCEGKTDIQNKILRHTSPAFVEDPLRVLRVARFAARFNDFTIATETMVEMQRIADAGELEYLTPERVWQEIQAAMCEAHPDIFFTVLRTCGALAIVWPELDAVWGGSPFQKTNVDSDKSSVASSVLGQATRLSPKTTVRFAALCNNLGNDIQLVERSCSRFKVPNAYRQLALRVCQFHSAYHKALALEPHQVLMLFNQLDVWRKPQDFDDFLVACDADARVRFGVDEAISDRIECLRTAADICAKVNAKKFVEKGLLGRSIKAAVDEERITLIKNLKTQ